ncbi:putative phosphoenolpyruvate synthase [Uloborus diversus]|uniref:putative phosphoenolpyruvate synthase n=1 Tax=Uloborus diversus TaxID=327109 RepID=UPI00240A3D08|nr:putative phosphoenolpyruvate synthase [Uloborus diversus]
MGVLLAIATGIYFLITKSTGFLKSYKWLLSYLIIRFQRWTKKKRFDLYNLEADHDPVKVGFIYPDEEWQLESPHPESHLIQGADEVFFYGVNSQSECLVARIARSTHHEAGAWIYLKLKNGKIYRLRDTSGYQQSSSDKKTFSCGGLQMHYIMPMRLWRIFFNGLLRETSDDDPNLNRMVHVKFAFLWRASSDAFDFQHDIDAGLLAEGLSNENWKDPLPPLEKLSGALNMYAQGGTISGTVGIDDNTEEHNLYLFGERLRFLGDITVVEGMEFFHVLGQITKNGQIIHVAEVSIKNVVKNLKLGFIVNPNGSVVPVTDMNIQNLSDVETEDSDVKASFDSDGFTFTLSSNLVGKQSHFESKTGWEGSFTIDCLNMELDSQKGSGVLIKGKVDKTSRKKLLKTETKQLPTETPYVVHFSEGVCQFPEVTGGKGSSLGTLTSLSKDLKNFVVPAGMVVTTTAYEAFLTDNIRKEVKHLENVLYGNTEGDVKEYCQRAEKVIMETSLPDSVLQAVIQELQKAFADKIHSMKFAIRSSATGEDTEQLSAAGQMETLLGVTGINEIVSAIKKCWSSQFGFVAVQYKRQNGQIINSPMAVVIQQMISCDVAGVLFTCNPLTGNPSTMSITANYGLGESVVSGSEEPDTIELQRDADDKLQVKNKIIGAKSRRIVLRDDTGTDVVDVSESERQSCCLSDEMALRLGHLAVKIEKCYRSHRDIEWGFWNNNLYIFQSRPVTSGSGATDYEIDHEVDDPLRTENEYFSVCNVGEVMPGAMSPLGLDVTVKFFGQMFRRRSLSDWNNAIRPNYFKKGMCHMYNHMMFYAADLMENMLDQSAAAQAGQIAIWGRVLHDDELLDMARERVGRRKKTPTLVRYVKLFLCYCIAEKRLKQAQKYYANFSVTEKKTAEEQFKELLYCCTDLTSSLNAHMLCSSMSSIYNMIVMSLLRDPEGELNDDVYNDFSKLLASISEVESADVPAAMQDLAYSIAQDIEPEVFKKMTSEEAENWLRTTKATAGEKFKDFLLKHGHRCLKEFDIHSVPWGADPKILISLLQNLVGSVKDPSSKKNIDFDKLLSELHIQLNSKTRMILKFLLPTCRKGVQNREASKSVLIRGVDAWRKGYCRLAKLMVSEGRIPDGDLLFFMTVDEIKELLETRSPSIIAKASHRRRRYPELNDYIFPETMKGFPIPINKGPMETEATGDGFMLKGIPVSQGVTKGFVRVAITLEEAAQLKPREILVTYSTDIGWSPYFPMLSGVVTELGGLISHGAVVSREYGLPCVAGLHGATRQFQTGDYVLLDGNKGILQKITPPEESSTS